ncbi:MAG: GGDEF domain-containing protein [Treponema sp.]|jgi:diguanylate cyclase (GGDEF)-like protein|nr:GGDEF domain-containing protein [Treponema sp.]
MDRPQNHEGIEMSGAFLYPVCATGLVILLIAFDYIRRLNTDAFLRKIYLLTLFSLFAAIVFNFIASLFDGKSGAPVRTLLFAFNSLYFITQNLAYYTVVLFIDYIAGRNSSRTGKLGCIVLVIMGINVIIMVLNLFFGFYFTITPDNRYADGSMYLVRFYLGYLAILILIVDLLTSSKFLTQVYMYQIVIFAILIGGGAALDMVFTDGNLIWAFFTAGMLKSYFYIIRADATQDAVTGIRNRASFSEYIGQIIRMPERQSLLMCLIDINGLKKINDSMGMEEGDRALADMADILRKCSRQNDFIARIGGDEFIVIIKAKFEIERLIARILRTVDARNQKADSPYPLAISYGFDKFTTRTDQTIDEFLSHLNDLVYQHKSDQRREAGA